MRISTPLIFVGLALFIARCGQGNSNADANKDTTKIAVDTITKTAPPPPKNDKIRNGIKLTSNILKVSQAFLMDAEGKLVSDDNVTGINQYLTLRLIIDSGWVPNNNIVKIGASEKVVASDGSIVLDEKDLFEGGDEVSPADANVIDIKVIIQQVIKLVDYYEVHFRVWDKIGAGDITGSYRFNVK